MNVKQNKEEHQFQLQIEGKTAYIDYTPKNGILQLNSTQVPESLSGKGVGSKLVRQSLDLIEAQGLKIEVFCSFIKGWMERHPEKNHLLA